MAIAIGINMEFIRHEDKSFAAGVERAAQLMPECIARRIALGSLDGGSGPRHFLSMAGIGFDAHIVYHLSARLKKHLGKGAYWISGFAQAVRRFPEFEIEVDGGTRAVCSFALVSRVRNYGGDFEIATSASVAIPIITADL